MDGSIFSQLDFEELKLFFKKTPKQGTTTKYIIILYKKDVITFCCNFFQRIHKQKRTKNSPENKRHMMPHTFTMSY